MKKRFLLLFIPAVLITEITSHKIMPAIAQIIAGVTETDIAS